MKCRICKDEVFNEGNGWRSKKSDSWCLNESSHEVEADPDEKEYVVQVRYRRSNDPQWHDAYILDDYEQTRVHYEHWSRMPGPPTDWRLIERVVSTRLIDISLLV